jgi:hypothetical protein
MKKTFSLKHPKIKPARLAEAARCEVRKYLKRSRHRELPEGSNVWEFDCKFGPTAEAAQVIDVADLGKAMCAAEEKKIESFYVEILAKPGTREKRPPPPPESDDDR